ASPAAVFDRMTQNVAALRSAVEGAEATDHRADLAGAVTLAGALLAGDAEAGGGEVVVVTDGQRSNWEELGGLALPEGVGVTLRTVADGEAVVTNTALRFPGVRPGAPGAGTAAEVGVEVAHWGEAARRVRVDLVVEGPGGVSGAADSRWVQVSPGERRRVTFAQRFAAAGAYTMRFSLGGSDAMGFDDEAALVVRCVERQPVVVVGSDNPEPPGSSGVEPSAGYFVTRALAPHGDARDRYRVTHVSGSAATDAALSGAALVCVTAGQGLTPASEAALVRYAEGGGSVLVFAGRRPVRSEALLPWRLGSRMASAKLTDGDWFSPALSGFDDAAREALGRASLRRAWRVRDEKPGTRVWLRFGNGSPALGAHAVGKGTVAAAAFSPAADSSELGKYGGFVVLMQSLAEHLTAGGADGEGGFEATAGGPVVIAAVDGAEASSGGSGGAVVGPDGASGGSGGSVLSFGLDDGVETAMLGA
ncbi:MAG: hypothetical protein AAFX76_14500, partial [Planctomycetota bacterium]